MITIAHIIHPVIVDPSSDLEIAQPITFETMHVAREFAREWVDVSLYAIQYHDERRLALPACFERIPDLTRSVGELHSFNQPRKLALIKDILDALYQASQAEYFVYSNVDIAVQPYFYLTIATLIERGYDAFAINRRTIPATCTSVADIPLMYAESGEKHPGWDCFIFKRAVYPQFELGQICIGTGWIGRAMLANMACCAKQFSVFTDLHATFHLGNARPWKSGQFDDYWEHNQQEFRTIFMTLESRYGPFDRDTIPGRFWRHLERAKEKRRDKYSIMLDFTAETQSAAEDKSTILMNANDILNRLIFIGGPPRSGTTFAAKSLNRHPKIVAAIDNHRYECLGLYDYRTRNGLVHNLRRPQPLSREQVRESLRNHLLANNCLKGVAPSPQTSGYPLAAPVQRDVPTVLLDQKLIRHTFPLAHFHEEWYLCVKSPEISFVLPRLAACFPAAKFIIVYRPLLEIAESMYRMGQLVKKIAVFHRKWKQEVSANGELIPPPGIPAAWFELWQTVSDFQRCIIYGASYLQALAEGIPRLAPDQALVYNHRTLRANPALSFTRLAEFLKIELSGFQPAISELRTESPVIETKLQQEYEELEPQLHVQEVMRRIEALYSI